MSISHATWDADAVLGMHAMYGAGVARCVGCSEFHFGFVRREGR
jgi:hypothetical protein